MSYVHSCTQTVVCVQDSLVGLSYGERVGQPAVRLLLSLHLGRLSRFVKYDHSCTETLDCWNIDTYIHKYHLYYDIV